jgi:CBS domain-containing protein
MMYRGFVVVAPDTSIGDVARRLQKKRANGAAVVDAERHFVGFISVQGLMAALVDFLYEEVPLGPVKKYLDPDPPKLSEESSLMAAVDLFVKEGQANLALPVLRGDRLVGLVTRLDVVRAAMDYFAGEEDKSPATLYLSALKKMDERPPY